MKSEVRAQNKKVGRLWFFRGGDAREYPGGVLRLDPAFAYAGPSFLMTFVQSGMPHRLPAHDQCMLSHDISV